VDPGDRQFVGWGWRVRNASTICRNLQVGAASLLAMLLSVSCGVGSAQMGNSSGNVTASNVSLNTSSLDFGNVEVGSSAAKAITLTNTSASDGPSVTFSQVTVTGSGFTVTTASLPILLTPGAASTVTVTFAPKVAGKVNGSLSITVVGASDPANVSLAGTGVAAGLLVISPSALSFGSVALGTTQTLPATLTNSGGSSVTVTEAALSGSGYSTTGLNLPLTLQAGQSTSFNVVFAPQSAGTDNSTLSITSNASNPTLTVLVSGTADAPGALSASAASLSFGQVTIGNSRTLPETLTNSGGASVIVSQAKLSESGFTMSGLSLPLTLTTGQSFTFSVTFAPQTAGAANGTIALVSDASSTTPSISLSGTGTAVGQFSVNPGSFSFGNVAVGASKSLAATLTATGSSVTVTLASVNSSEFALTGPSLPLTITTGGAASFTLTFTPQASGTASATVSFATNASGSPATESATGTGIAAPQHLVNLGWSETSSSLAGFNVYRSVTSGGPYAKLNASTDPNANYTDNSVEAGQTYYYVTTSVGTDGTESAYSNQASAAIPTP
jgi:hypothetical protein